MSLSNVTDSPVEPTPGRTPVSELGKTIKTGAGWTIAARFCGRVVRVLTFFLLAKILGPERLGVVGIIYVVDPLGMLLTRLGFSAAIIQKEDANADHFDSAMIISVGAGVTLAAVLACSASTIGRLLDDELLGRLLLPYSLVFVVRSFSYVPSAVLRRKMAFRKFAVMGEFANVTGCIVMLALALGGLGVWSVLWAELTRAVLLSGFSIGLSGHRFRPRFRLEAARELSGFAGWTTLTAFSYYGLCNIDYVIVRVVFGPTAMGWYVLAFRLISQPFEQIATRLYEVMFPAFSRYQDQPAEVLRVYRKLVCGIALFALPLLGIAIVLADEFFLVVMGPEWQGAILPFQILCVAGMIRAFVGSSSALLKSRGYVRFEGTALAALFGLMAASVGVGTFFGLPGVAIAVDVVMIVYLTAYLVYQGRKNIASAGVFVDAILPVVQCTLVAVAACIGVAWLLTAVGDVARLFISGAVATIIFVLAVMRHPNSTVRSVVWELKRVLRRTKDDE